MPLDETVVEPVRCGELSPPIDRESYLDHSLLDVVPEIVRHLPRFFQTDEFSGRDSIDLCECLDYLWVILAEPFCHGVQSRTSGVESHRRERVESAHPVKSGVGISNCVGSSVADVLGRVWIGISGCNEVLWSTRVGIRLIDLGPCPFLLPFPLQSSPVELRQFLGHFFGGWGRELSLDGLFHNFHRVFGLILVRPSACREERSAATASANCPGGAGNNLACVDSCLDRLV